MKTILKKVYYCDYCKKRGMSAGAMSKHEKHCTNNPNRDCRMCSNLGVDSLPLDELLVLLPEPTLLQYFTEEQEEIIINLLWEKTDGCPMCMFSALRQKGILKALPTWQLKDALEQAWKENKISYEKSLYQ